MPFDPEVDTELPLDAVPEAPAEPSQSIEEAAPAEMPEQGKKSRDPVPYDRFKAVNKEKKFLRKQVMELQAIVSRNNPTQTPQAAPPAPVSKAPADPKQAAVWNLVQDASSEALDPVKRELAELRAERQFERAEQGKDSFWKDHSEDTDLKEAVENRFNNMVQMAVQNGQKPLFTREDLYNYELGLKTRESRSKAAQSRQSEAAVKKVAQAVVGARPGAQRAAPKPVADKSAAELREDPDFSRFEF
jgi:hypothetical protein